MQGSPPGRERSPPTRLAPPRRANLNGRVYYARRHTFTLHAAATVTATHTAAADARRLDPYLLLLAGHGSLGTVIETDYDSGPGRNAQITATLQPGSYTLEATAFGTRRTGSYTLTIDSAAVAGCTAHLGTLAAGQTVRSGWDSSSAPSSGRSRHDRRRNSPCVPSERHSPPARRSGPARDAPWTGHGPAAALRPRRRGPPRATTR